MKGKDHIRSRGEKNKRIRIKKGGKTRGKSIGKLGRGGGDKNQQPLELDGDPANACDTEKATKYIANLPEPHAVNTEAQIVSSHWHLYNSQPAGELAIGEAHSSLLFANTVIASSQLLTPLSFPSVKQSSLPTLCSFLTRKRPSQYSCKAWS